MGHERGITPWQRRREELERTERNIRLAVCGLIILGVLFLHSISKGPEGADHVSVDDLKAAAKASALREVRP